MNEEKTLPNGVRIAIAITTLVSVLIAFNQCTVDKTTNTKRSTASTSSSTAAPSTNTTDGGDTTSGATLPDGLVMPPMNAPTAESELDTIDVGVKDFEQIYQSMATLTGVGPSDPTIMGVYKDLTVQMPVDNNAKSFLPANQVAITKLAAEFCEKMVETQTLRVVVWPTINFTQTPAQVFNATSKQLIINQAIAKFMPPLDSTTQVLTFNELSKLFDDLLSGEVLTSSVTTRKVVKGMCISTLASAHATLL
ncbi:MAG: hypothetical protein H7177_15970 [Rhizobacter sp.]|nr:hypothetical protein [Bacteriovorax sp.]